MAAASGGAAAAASADSTVQDYESVFSEMETKQEVEKSLNGYKAARTRVYREAERLIPSVRDTPNTLLIRDMERLGDKIGHYRNVLEAGYMRLEVLDAAQYKTYDAAIETLYNETNEKLDEVYQVIMTARQSIAPPTAPSYAAAAAAAAAAGRPTKVRPDEVLKPAVLTLDYMPEEMRTWMTGFRAFYTSSEFEKVGVAQQQAYLMICLNHTLQNRLREEIEPDTPVLPDRANPNAKSCLGLIEQEFVRKYPIFLRRLRFFKYDQKPGQLFSDYAAKLRKIGDEAELARVGPNELYIYRFFTGCKDEELLTKFLDLGICDLDRLREVYRIYEQSGVALKALGAGGGNKASQASGGGGGGGGGRRHDSRQRKDRSESKNRGKKEKKCHRCGKTNHEPRDCPQKDATCHYCKGKGHIRPVCRVLKREQKEKEGGESEKHERGRSPAGSGRRSPSPSPPRRSKSLNASVICRASGSIPTPKMLLTVVSGDGKEMQVWATPDTGSTRTIFPLQLLQEYGMQQELEESDKERLFAADGGEMKCEGRFPCKASCYGRPHIDVDAIVSSVVREPLISWHDLVKLNVIPAGFPGVAAPSIAEMVSASKEKDGGGGVSLPPSIPLSRSLTAPPEDEAPATLEQLLVDYADVVRDKLGEKVLAGPPMTIYLRDDIEFKPRQVLVARQVPRHRQEKAKQLIFDMVDRKVIAPVDKPTKVTSASHFVDKPGGGVRLTTDYKHSLNPYVRRPVHPFPTTEEILQQIEPTSKYFAKMDANILPKWMLYRDIFRFPLMKRVLF